jgi:serine protease AprX
VIKGLQWVLDNKTRHNIKVVNLSLNSSVAQSYHTSPLCAAVEILWFNGIVVVVSAGNNGTANLYPPANDPFVITVGATDDRGTTSMSDDIIASFSAHGTDEANNTKPDLVAPGRNIISNLPDNQQLTISINHPTNRLNEHYFRMSGTSMAAPVVAGAVALLLQDEPNLTPDQVKYRLKTTAVSSTVTWPGYNSARAGAGYLDASAAVNGTTSQSANTGLVASQLLWTGNEPVNWNSVNWNSVNWNSVNWNSDHWDE